MLDGATYMVLRRWLEGELVSRHRDQWVVNSLLPPFPSNAFNRLFEKQFLDRSSFCPVAASLAITPACPYHCWHCSFHGRAVEQLETKVWLKTIAELHALGVSIVVFTGGEPLCRPDLPELVEAVRAGGAEPLVFTCGALLDAPWVQRLKDAGLWAMSVSLDHPDEAECDRQRGAKGAGRAAREALRLASSAGFYTIFTTVTTPQLLREGLHLQLYELGRELGAHEHRLIEPKACGRLEDAGELMLTPELEALTRDYHLRVNQRGRLPKVCAQSYLESSEILGCGAGTRYLYIDPSGEVCPCDFSARSFGNITRSPLAAIWQRVNRAVLEGLGRPCSPAVPRQAAA